MISEGSCDTEDWSNAGNSALHHINKVYKYIKIENCNNNNDNNSSVIILLFLLYIWYGDH